MSATDRNPAVTRIRLAMIETKITQAELADAADCHEKTVQNLMNGRSVRDQTLFDVCMVLGLDFDEIKLAWTGPPPARPAAPAPMEKDMPGKPGIGSDEAPLYMGAYSRDAVDHYVGSYLTLRDLIDEAGRDATRWFLVARKPDSQLTFDIDLARSQSLDNPVYYVQVAHARTCGLMRQLKERGLSYDQGNGLAQPLDLTDEAAHELVTTVLRYPDVVAAAGEQLEPHQIAAYLLELAQTFQTYYNDHQFLVDEPSERDARLVLAAATRQVLANGLELLGVSAPEVM